MHILHIYDILNSSQLQYNEFIGYVGCAHRQQIDTLQLFKTCQLTSTSNDKKLTPQRTLFKALSSDEIEPRWDVGVRIRPQHPLACRKRRINGAACLPWAATRVAWGKDPGGWGFELTATSSGSNTPLWPLLVLDGRLNSARFNQSAGRAEPRDEWLFVVI